MMLATTACLIGDHFITASLNGWLFAYFITQSDKKMCILFDTITTRDNNATITLDDRSFSTKMRVSIISKIRIKKMDNKRSTSSRSPGDVEGEPVAKKTRLVHKTIIYDESVANQWLDEPPLEV